MRRIINMKLQPDFLPRAVPLIAILAISVLLFASRSGNLDSIFQQSVISEDELTKNNPAEENSSDDALAATSAAFHTSDNVPDFSAIKDVRLKKRTFFEFM